MIDPNELPQSSVSRRDFPTGELAPASPRALYTMDAAETVFASSPGALTTYNSRKEPTQ